SYKASHHLQQVLNRITDAVIAFDNNWHYTYVNNKAAQLFNQSPEEIIGQHILNITPTIEKSTFYAFLLEAQRTGIAQFVILFDPFEERWYDNRIYPDASGVSVYYKDITEKKTLSLQLEQVNQKLQETLSRFESLSEVTNDAIYDWNILEDDVWGNDNYYKIIAHSSEQTNNFNRFTSLMHPDDLAVGLVLLETAFKKQLPKIINEFRIKNKTEEWSYYLNRQQVFYTADGRAKRILGALMDITEQKRIEQQILHEKKLSDTLINSLPGLFYMFRENGSFIRWNDNFLRVTGYVAEEMASLNPLLFVPEEEQAILASKIQQVFTNGSDQIEATLLTKTGNRIPYYFTGRRIMHNGIPCAMGVGIDISEKINYQQELQALTAHLQRIREEERNHMAREIHDELGQQLTGLNMELSWLLKKVDDKNPELKQKINEAIHTTQNTVRSVRKIIADLRPVMLDELGLPSTLEWQLAEFEKKYTLPYELTIDPAFPDLLPTAKNALYRIFQESLTNIIKHAKASLVSVRLFCHHDQIILEITDNGIGFDINEVKPKQGYGLIGMKERAMMLGGSIDISTIAHQGTQLIVLLPADQNRLIP
ncbi:MAG: PAS domain S-box protein, partial [Ferruginibacter sp.]